MPRWLRLFTFNKIILGIIPEKSASKSDLINAGHLVFYKNDSIKLANSISNMLNNKMYYQENININYWKRFLPSTVARQIKEILLS